MTKNNKAFISIAKIAGAMAASFLAAGQASAHVSYGHALYDDSGAGPSGGTLAEDTIMHLGAANKGTASCQGAGCPAPVTSITVSSNAGFLESQDRHYWANSHDSKFMWFYVSQPTSIQFTITGNANPDYVSAVTGSTLKGANTPIDTLNPAFVLFKGAAPYLAHDGAYGAFNTGFARWSSWAQQTLPEGYTYGKKSTKFVGVGKSKPDSEGNPIKGLPYLNDASAVNRPGELIAKGKTEHMGTYGGYEKRGTGPSGEKGFWIANNQTLVKYADGTDLTVHEGFLQFVAKGSNPSGNTLSSGAILLTEPGVYTLIVGGANQTDATNLVTDAMAVGMAGPEGCPTDPATGFCLNGLDMTDPAVITAFDQYRNVDRRARSYTIQFQGTPQ